MTQQDKDLLLRDLCARLPYGVYVYADGLGNYKLSSIELYKGNVIIEINEEKLPYHLYEIKPYLRPMSSMTHSEYDEYLRIKTHGKPFEVIDWLNARHIDYRKLIEKGLAIAVTDGNNPYK